MRGLLHLGEILRTRARMTPERLGARDLDRAMSFTLWNERSCRFANALAGLGLAKGDRIAILAYNCLEWAEFYAGTAKAGIIAVPINFRLVGDEIRYIIADSGASALIVQDLLADRVEAIRGAIGIPDERMIGFGSSIPAGYRSYESLLARARDLEPEIEVGPRDPWVIMYTSGTTGRPKGAVRSHGAQAIHCLTTAIELGLGPNDRCLLAMPMCHANSLYFATTLTYCGGAVSIYSRSHFEPEHFLKTLGTDGHSFTSLVPTHYVAMLELPETVRRSVNADAVRKLLISSAPARGETKQEVMAMFRNSGLYEGYGSTEAGWVTMLHPDEQFSKLGTIGRECVGTGPIRLIGEDGKEVPDGEVGELYSRTPYAFDGYWGLPDKTKDAFCGDYCTVNDMARRDPDGYYVLVDRKSNMIVSGGENIYPSEVEAVLAGHPDVRAVAVIGLPDPKWGERVHAVVVPRDDIGASEVAIIEWCRNRIAGYKRPRSLSFVSDDEMPRTATGKIQHRILKMRLAGHGNT